jgi:hypothetical protein
MLFIKNLINRCLEKLSLSSDALSLTNKQKQLNNILIKKNEIIQKITPKDFFELFNVEYLPNLYFQDKKILKKIIKKCKKRVKNGSIYEKEIWLGIYHKDKINSSFSAPVYLKWIDDCKGYGLFALCDLKKDTYIGEYTGVVRKHKRQLDKKNSYCFEYKLGDEKKAKFTIDAKYMGNYVRFINHSYSPNIMPYAAYTNGVIHIILKTNSDVFKGQELFYDYGPTYWKKREAPV